MNESLDQLFLSKQRDQLRSVEGEEEEEKMEKKKFQVLHFPLVSLWDIRLFETKLLWLLPLIYYIKTKRRFF